MYNKFRTIITVSTSCFLSMLFAFNVQAQDSNQASDSATALEEDSLLEEVVVLGTRASLKKARDIEKDSDIWKNVVAADDIGNFPDQNVAESLQRLPGVSISRDEGEGRFVIVRGLSPAFNNVTINGVRIGATGENPGGLTSSDNIVSLDAVPSDLLNGIEVTKTTTPDMDGDAIAGTINLLTLSAFDRKDNSASLRVEGSYNVRGGKLSPKVSGSITRLFDTSAGEKTLGIALTGSYFDRDIELDDLRVARSSGSDLRAFDLGDGEYYRPEEIDQRIEIGTRTRYGGTANIEFRPNNDSRYYLNLVGSKLRDQDIRIQQEWELRRASGSEVKVIGPNTGVFDDVDLEKQIFFKDTTSTVFSASVGGENTFNDFELSYQADYSKSRYNNPLGTRGRFRERDGLVFYSATDDSVIVNQTPDTDEYQSKKTGPDFSDAAKFNFDNILVDDFKAVDKIYSANVDGKWYMDFSGRSAYIKTGFKIRSRDKFADKEQLDMNPQDFGFSVTMADIGTWDPKNTNLDNFVLIPDLAASQQLFNAARDAMLADGGFNASVANDDFSVTEDILAGYVMGQMQISDAFSVIAGARFEKTKLNSDGTISETLRTCDDPECENTTTTPIGLGAITTSTSYTDILPSLHFSYQPSDELIMRLAFTKALKRPAFDQNRPNINIATIEQDDGTYLRGYVGGNPDLETLRANQFDFLVSWYPTDSLAITGGVFYKDIKDFIVSVALSGDDVALAGFPVADGTIDGGYDSVLTFINGDEATISGIELSYFQAFAALPGIFVDANATWTDSESKIPLIDPDKIYTLPDQPDFIGNFSIGYENRKLTLRLSGNYVGEKLETVASDSAMDEIRQSRFSVDFGVRYNINEMFQVYADAINLNEAKDVRVFRNGDNAPRMFERVQDYGRTFQLGVRATF